MLLLMRTNILKLGGIGLGSACPQYNYSFATNANVHASLEFLVNQFLKVNLSLEFRPDFAG